MRHLSDLDELLESVRSSYSREYLTEAITTYRAGAYRAAVAITWVAVCIDIMEKIRELSAEGDQKAIRLERELESFSTSHDKQKMQNFENQLLEKACKELNIISEIENGHLSRIKDDRNLSVHPTFQKEGQHFKISSEIARAHIVVACDCLLSQPPVRGKNLINKILERIKENSFSLDFDKAYLILSSEHYLGRAQDGVYQDLCNIVLKSIFLPNAPTLNFNEIKQHLLLLSIVERLNPKIFKDVVSQKINGLLSGCNDSLFARLFILLNSSQSIWVFLDSSSKIRVLELLSGFSEKDFIQLEICNLVDISEDIKNIFLKKDSAFLLKIAQKTPAKIFKDIVANTFVESLSFDTAKIYGIRYLLPHAKYFDNNDLNTLLEKSLANDQIMYAWGLDDIFVNLYKECYPGRGDTWQRFWEKIKNKGSFSKLQTTLVEQGILNEKPIEKI